MNKDTTNHPRRRQKQDLEVLQAFFLQEEWLQWTYSKQWERNKDLEDVLLEIEEALTNGPARARGLADINTCKMS